jgi:hypothetical protein
MSAPNFLHSVFISCFRYSLPSTYFLCRHSMDSLFSALYLLWMFDSASASLFFQAWSRNEGYDSISVHTHFGLCTFLYSIRRCTIKISYHWIFHAWSTLFLLYTSLLMCIQTVFCRFFVQSHRPDPGDVVVGLAQRGSPFVVLTCVCIHARMMKIVRFLCNRTPPILSFYHDTLKE